MAALAREWAAILQAEQRQGYLDSSVLGGFGEWLASLGRPERARALLEAAEQPEALKQPTGSIQQKPSAADCLQTSIEYLKGVGPKRAVLLRRLGIYKIADLLFNRPRAYESRPQPVAIAQLSAWQGDIAAVRARHWQFGGSLV